MRTSNYCAGLRSFSNLPEKGFLFYFIFFIPTGIRTTLPNAGLYFEDNEKNLKIDSLFNWEPLQGKMGAMCDLWLGLVSTVAWLHLELT